MLAEAGGRLVLNEGLTLPADPLLGTVIHSLLHWGEVQEEPKMQQMEIKGSGQLETGAQASPTTTRELNGWQVPLQKVWRLLRRKPKLSRIENGKGITAPSSRSPNTPFGEG
jgi:hypothetical protein